MEKVGNAAMPELPLILFGGLFLVVGIGMWANIVWGLLTGGPRDREKPDQPFLFDRLYYLLFLVGLIGWSTALLSVPAASEGGEARTVTAFMIGWGIGAIAMGFLLLLRGEMMLNGRRYLSRHGFVLFRLFQQMQLRSLERQTWAWKIIAPIFILVGIGVLIFNLPHLTDVPGQVIRGAQILVADTVRVVTGRSLADRV